MKQFKLFLGLSVLLFVLVANKIPSINAQTETPQEDCDTTTIISDVEFSPDGEYIAAGTWDTKTIRLSRAQTGKLVRTFSISPTESGGLILSLAFSPDGEYIAAGTSKAQIVLWNLQTGEIVQSFSPEIVEREFLYEITNVAFTPDGKYILTGDKLGGRLWDIETGEMLRFFPSGETSGGDSVFLSSDGKFVITQGRPPKLWDTETGELLYTFDAYNAWFSSTGKFILTIGLDVNLWDVSTRKKLVSIDVPGYYERFSPNDHYLLDIGYSTLTIAEVETGKQLYNWSFKNYRDYDYRATFSADSKYLFFTNDTTFESDDFTRVVVMWDIARSVEMCRFNIYQPSSIFKVSPDSKYLLFSIG